MANRPAKIGKPSNPLVKEDVSVNGSGNLTAVGTISISDADTGQASFLTSVVAFPDVLGALTLAADGSYTYTVGNSAVQHLITGEIKAESFTVTSIDGTTQVVTFRIYGLNDVASIGTPTVTQVTEDTDVSGGNLIATGMIPIDDPDAGQEAFQTNVTPAAGVLGSLTLASDGSYTYSVANSAVQYLGAGQTKVETFTVTAVDGKAKYVSFTINGAGDDAIVGAPSVDTVTEDINVGSNARITITGTIPVSDADAGQASFTTVVTPAAGTLGALTLAANGSYTYSVLNSRTQSLGEGETKVETFTVTTIGGTTKDISFVIDGANDGAVIGKPSALVVKEDVAVNGSGNLTAVGTISISDADAGQASFLTSVVAFPDVLGALTLAADGSYTYTVGNSAVQHLITGEIKAESFTVTSIDGTTQVVTFRIYGLNDVASIGTPTVTQVTEDTDVSGGNLIATGMIPIDDPDAGQEAFQTNVTPAAGVLGSLTLASDGSYTYSVANSAVQYLGAGQTKVETFTVTAVDGKAKYVSFTINGAGDDAIVGAPSVDTVTEDINVGSNARITITGTIPVSDADAGQASFTTVVTPAAGTLGALTLAANGSYTYSVLNSRTQSLGEGETKVETFTVTTIGGTTKDISFVIDGANDGAVIGKPSALVVKEDVAVNGSGNLTAVGTISISDADAGQASFLTSVVAFPDVLGALTLAADGSYTYTVGNSAVQHLITGEIKAESFTVTSIDGTAQVVTFRIYGLNDVASIGTPTVTQVTEDTDVSGGNLIATGMIPIDDPDAGQEAFQTNVTPAAGVLGSLTLASDGSYTYSVANSAVQYLGAGQTKVETFTVTAVDGKAKYVSFTINGKNEGAIVGDSGDNTLVGTSGDDTIQGLGGNDILQGLGGNDNLDGGTGLDRASYADATGGVTIAMAAGTASGPGVGSDTLTSIESVLGSMYADVYDATNFNPATAPTPGTVRILNNFEGGGGNDTITGNYNAVSNSYGTTASYAGALGGVTVNLGAGTASGTAAGDAAGVGADTLVNVGGVIGSAFADVLTGGGLSQVELFTGRDGADLIDGKGGLDTAIYSNESQAITVNLAAGTVTGGDGNDTLRSVEQIRGTAYADTFNATGFGGGSVNAGSNGTFNEFEGLGGNDSVTGNGNTRLSYQTAAAAVTVDFLTGMGQGTAAGDLAKVGIDTFSGVSQVRGSTFGDTIRGGSGNDMFDGRDGDDLLDGRDGFDTAAYNTNPNVMAGIAVDMAAGTVTGDTFSGIDTLRSIEQVNGSFFGDTYTAAGFGQSGALNVGNNGTFNAFQGFGGNDTVTGNGNTQVAYFNATAAVTIDLQAGTGQGTAAGDAAGVGVDTFTGGVNAIAGSNFADMLSGTDNAAFTTETFDGRGGNDTINGRGGYDLVAYSSDPSVTAGINVNLAAGTVTGQATIIDTDTLRAIEAVRGTGFADTFNATGFGSGSINAGSLGTLNDFEGLGGNDTITGNGDTRVSFGNSAQGVTVDLAAGTATGAAIGSDTITGGVSRVRGSNAADTISGSAGNNILEGMNGNDTINGRGGSDTLTGGAGADTFVFAGGGGLDFVTDFNQGQSDRIDLTGISGVYTLSDVQSLATQDGTSTAIDFGNGDKLTLFNVNKDSLVAGDFIFSIPITGDSGDNTLVGTSGDDTIQGLGGNDILQGLGGNDNLDGGTGLDRASYADATGGVTIAMAAGTASGPGVGSDTLTSIESVLGSMYADVYDATNFNPATAPTPGTVRILNNFEGGGGNDTITGNYNAVSNSYGTTASYAGALGGVTVNLGAGTASGTAAGDAAGVGADTLVNVGGVIGSAFADVLTGGGLSQVELFTGRDGADLIDGKGGLDTAIYSNESQAITVNLAAGTVTGGDGNDTLRSVEQIRGTAYADTFNATGFGGGSVNAGSNGTFNEFEGLGGNDSVTGNGNTRLSYQTAAAAVTVDFLTGMGQGTAAGDLAKVGIDTFSGVSQVRGSTFGDTIRGGSGNDMFDGRDGDDLLDGRDGFDTAAYNTNPNVMAGIAVDMAAGTVTGDTFSGIDTLRSIEQVNGSFFGDTYTAAGFGQSGALNVGNNGTFNAFQGFGGNDTVTGNGNTQVAYFNATAAVTIDLQAGTGQGTAAGDAAGVGVDTFTGGVNAIAGSNFADMLSGTDNAAFTTETFDGRGGNDTINGRGGYDLVAYSSDPSVTAGINVNLAAGTVTGQATIIDTDTLRAIEAVRGTGFADTFNATGFGSGSINAGSLGTLNDFEGLGGNDTITGNGDTRVSFGNSAQGVTVDLAAGTATGAAIGSDTITGGVSRVRGSNAADTISGSAGNNILEGMNGNDTINGRGGSDTLTGGAGADTFVFAAAMSGINVDTVTDYLFDVDKFDVSSFHVANYAALESMMTEAGNTVTITFDANNELKIAATSISTLSAHQSDFLL